MHLIVCLEDRGGMAFAGRRVSSDRFVTDHILKISSGCKLWVSPASGDIFPETDVLISPEFLEEAGRGDYCFADVTPLPSKLEGLESVTLYHWNRTYPSTVKFPRELLSGMELTHTEEFPGYSHETVTMERYTK